jgi:hypothetical protein
MRAFEGRILAGMVRQLGVLVLATIVIAAPAALTLCEMRCATAAAQTDSDGSEHSCHSAAVSHDGPSLTAGTHICGHADVMPIAGKLLIPDAPALGVSTLPAHLWQPESAGDPLAVLFALPPGTHTLPVPLRI